MAYAADRTPLELTALTSLASDDTIIVGDTSDVSEVAKSITKANLITDLTTSFATATQGATADSATQPGDNISTLTNDSGFTTNTGDALVANPLSQFAATTSAQLAGVLSDETGTGAAVFANSPTLVTPALGTPASGVATNLTGTAAGLTAGNVTTNANLTGPITSVGNATTIADAELAAIAGLTSAADRLPYFTGSGTASLATFTAAGRALVDDASASAQRTTLGVGTGDSPQFTAVNVGNATDTTITRTAAGTIAVEGNVIYRAGGTDVPVTDGGTGASDAATARTNLGAAPTASPTFTGDTTVADLQITGEFGADAEVDDGNSSTADTIDWTTGNFHKSTMTGNCTYTFTAPTYVGRYQLKLVQDGTGSRTATWPAAVKWPGGTAPTLTTTAAAIDIITFYWDGTNYFGVDSLAFA